MGQRSIRFPDALEARVLERAEAEDRSFSYIVVRALEKALGEKASASAPVAAGTSEPSRAPVEKGPEMRGLEVIAGNLSNALHDDPTAPLFKCPVARCTFRAKSPVAKCGMHGRTVVAA